MSMPPPCLHNSATTAQTKLVFCRLCPVSPRGLVAFGRRRKDGVCSNTPRCVCRLGPTKKEGLHCPAVEVVSSPRRVRCGCTKYFSSPPLFYLLPRRCCAGLRCFVFFAFGFLLWFVSFRSFQILAAICGTQGLSNSDLTLRTRSCYFLTKLVKAMREGVVQYVDVIVPGVQGEERKPGGGSVKGGGLFGSLWREMYAMGGGRKNCTYVPVSEFVCGTWVPCFLCMCLRSGGIPVNLKDMSLIIPVGFRL